jgi:hypothetical protein
MVSRVALDGGKVDERVLAEVYDATSWSLTGSGAPPTDHYATLSTGVDGAVEVGVGYEDSDGSGDINRSDDPTYHLCAGTESMGIVYLDSVPRLDLAMKLTAVGSSAGWSALALDVGKFAENAALIGLTTGPDCPSGS